VPRRVDRTGRSSILRHRYHVGRHLTGEAVTTESADGLVHVTHIGVVVATHARRHLIDDDDKMDRRPWRPAPPTKVARCCGSWTSTDRSASRAPAIASATASSEPLSERVVGDTVQITLDGLLLRTHRARHDKSKEFGALAHPHGKPRRSHDGET
jgi:hypothetical protein